jgi:hypothetical protein
MKKKYEALDGEQFDSAKAAIDHEDKLFEAWINTHDQTVDVASFLAVLDDEEEDHEGDTARGTARIFLRKYFEELDHES